LKALWLLVLVGCLPSSSRVCGDGRICPDDQVCAHVTDPDEDLCADPAQLDACAGRSTYAHCGGNSRCYDGVCLPVSCGNGRIDRADPADPLDQGEVCDDGNERSGDGCSSDCRSDETCGNGVVDPIKLERCDDGDLVSNDGCDSVCQPEQLQWRAVSAGPPTLVRPEIAYDAARDRVVMFGGLDIADAPTSETWEATATGFVQAHPMTSPPARVSGAMAYDVAHRRTILFGGGLLGDTWIWDGTNWSQPVLIDAPSPRSGHAMAYDARRGRVVLFGGRPAGILGNSHETWEWNGSAWTQITTATTPRGLSGHAMAYDPRRGKIVMFGDATSDSNVWEYDGVNWRQVIVSGNVPVARNYPSLAYDSRLGRVVLVGGETDNGELGDMWSWDGIAWTLMAPVTPAPNAGHVMAADTRRGRLILIGEVNPHVGGGYGKWTWSGGAWSEEPADTSISDTAVSAALDPLRGRYVIVGNLGAAELDGSKWFATATPGGQNLQLAALAYDPIHRNTVLFGGKLGADSAGATWTWDGTSWSQRTPTTMPPARQSGSIAFDAKASRIVMFGGATCSDPTCDVLDDTWEWDGVDWHLASSAHRPPGRRRAAFAYDPIRQQIVLFGGIDASGVAFGDTWIWDGSDWTVQQPSAAPSARAGAAIAWDAARARLVLTGGTSATTYANADVWEWDGATWIRQPVNDVPVRTGHALAQGIAGGIAMFGGSTSLGTPTSEVDVLRWSGASPAEACRSNIDGDGDGLAGCADPDCWWACAPLCPPGAPCDPTAPHCGDGECNPALEDGWICPADCTRPVICGDSICDPGETDCPGDCP